MMALDARLEEAQSMVDGEEHQNPLTRFPATRELPSTCRSFHHLIGQPSSSYCLSPSAYRIKGQRAYGISYEYVVFE